MLTGGDSAIGSESPRSFPRLATPTPHVNWVLYPEHSFPISRHCEQYGLLRSHFTPLFEHVKQSSAAPPAGARLLRLRTAATSALGFDGVGSGTVIVAISCDSPRYQATRSSCRFPESLLTLEATADLVIVEFQKSVGTSTVNVTGLDTCELIWKKSSHASLDYQVQMRENAVENRRTKRWARRP